MYQSKHKILYKWIFILIVAIDLALPLIVLATESPKDGTCAKAISGRVVKIHPLERKNKKPALIPPPRVADLLAALNKLISDDKIFETIEQLPNWLVVNAEKFEELLLEEQLKLLENLEAHGVNDAKTLLRALSIKRKAASSKYQDTDEGFVDPSVYKVMKGHKIEILVEVPQQGVSRSQSGFYRYLIDKKMKVIGLDMSNNDIRRLQLSQNESLLGKVKKPEAQTSGDKVAHVTGILGLVQLLNRNPNHPGLIYGDTVAEKMRSEIATNYSYELLDGVVKDPPGYSNQGMLVFENGMSVEMTNIRMLNIVGIDATKLLDRKEDEIYLGKRVRVWFQKLRKWITGRVIVPDSARGFIEVLADEVVTDNLEYHGGRGISVGRKSADLDLRDPSVYSERIHPLQNYPQIEIGKVVKFKTKDQETDYGYIDDINSDSGYYEVKDSLGNRPKIRFEEKVQFLDLEVTPPELTLVRRDGRISVADYSTKKERVYRILAYDPDDRIIVTKIVSLRPRGIELVSTFYLDDPRLTFVGNDNSEVFTLHPELSRVPKYLSTHLVEFYRAPGATLTGTINSIETLPVYIEVIVAKPPDQIGDDGDIYFRFNVRPSQIIRVWKPKK